MSKKLLREYYELCEGGICQDLLTEDEKRFVANGGMILSGKLQEADCRNGNGREYPAAILEREMKNYSKVVVLLFNESLPIQSFKISFLYV